MEAKIEIEGIPQGAYFGSIVSADFINNLGKLLYNRIPEKPLSAIETAMKILRPIIYVQTGSMIAGNILEMLDTVIREISREMEGKALVLYLNPDKVIVDYRICLGEGKTHGIPVYFYEIDDSMQPTRTLVGSGLDRNGQDYLHETTN